MRARPWMMTCAPVSLLGLSRTGFMSVWGASPAACACSACARPISPPSTVTALFSAMFCGLNGATGTRPRQHAAQAGHDGALARVGSGALDHQGAAQGTPGREEIGSEAGSSRIARLSQHRPGAREVWRTSLQDRCGRLQYVA
jgi:hypothetical protein